MVYKILYIVPNLYASSGVTKVVLNYVRNIDKNMFKIDFLVLSKNQNNCEVELRKNGCDIFYLNNRIINYFSLKKEIYHFFVKSDYRVIELHAPNLSFLFLKMAEKANIPFRIIHTHSTIKSSNFLKNIIWSILNINMKKYANYYFSCSNLSFNYWFGKKMYEKNNCFIIPNGTNRDKFKFSINTRRKIRNELGIDDSYVIGYVGRISKDKNLSFLVDVFRKIDKENVKLVFVGDILIPGFDKKCKELSDNIIFVGYKKNVQDYYNAFDVLVLPSKREGLPTSIVEAQLCRTRCIISDSITKEVDIGGVCFVKLNKKYWMNKILEYIDNFKIDKSYFDVDYSRFDIFENVRELEKIYKRMFSTEEKN